MTKLGITGGIGSGKSYVCRILAEQFGIPVYNCDIRARIIMLTDEDVAGRLDELIPGLYDMEGEPDKAKLANYLFASDENAARVNAIVHPSVRRDLRNWCDRRSGLVAVESAILYESHFDSEVDKVLFVDAPLELRIQRVMARDGLGRDEVLHRMGSQRPQEARGRADFLLMNDGGDVAPRLREILESLNHQQHTSLK